MRDTILLATTILVACATSTTAEPRESALDVSRPDRVEETSVQVQERPAPRPTVRPATGRPAPGPFPDPPDAERPEGERPPVTVKIGPDAAVVGRLIAEGLVAHIEFDARAGELSLFELTAWGFTRGWTSTSALVIRDASGAEVARSDRVGGTVFEDVLPFVAPEDGAYTLDVVAVASGFRYLVIRHSGFSPRSVEDRFSVGDRDVVHGWIAGLDDRVVFRVTGKPGEIVVLRADPTMPRAARQKLRLRRRLVRATAGCVPLERLLNALDARARDDGSFPDLVLNLDPAIRVEGDGHAVIARVPESGTFDVTVRRSNEGPPGLFDLMIQRSVEFARVEIRLGDGDDDPLPGAKVAVFREPGIDLVGRGTTDAEGIARVEVPVGDYTLVYWNPANGAMATTRTRLTGKAVNLVLDPRSGR